MEIERIKQLIKDRFKFIFYIWHNDLDNFDGTFTTRIPGLYLERIIPMGQNYRQSGYQNTSDLCARDFIVFKTTSCNKLARL